MTKSQDLTKGTLWKQMLLFFFPIALGTIFQQLYNAVDAIIVGKYVGTEALAAVGGTPGVYINFLISVFVGLTGGSAVIIAQLYGAGKHKMLEKATGTAITFCLVLGAVLTITATLLTDPVLRLLGTPEDTMADSATYLRIYFAGTILMLLLNIESGILRAVGDSRSPLIYMIISCVSNIVLDLLFVIQFGLGVAGVAYATVIAEFINTALLTVKLIRT
ncbi:MAG: polysaccharide biosynthesis C-terminal domain-containing protein, partial [Lachnospiraceae bacterium]|nr:polysaccharide biosynthesis C-terminal domain-containing protein [Candidatus Hippenecus merdae]